MFDSNVPNFFDSGQRAAFAKFLEGDARYMVMEHEGELVGCGGYRVDAETKRARLEWGMIQRGCQRKGLGRFLLLYRLREIGKSADIEFVTVDAPPAVAPFFERQGFKPGSGTTLVMRLKVCS